MLGTTHANSIIHRWGQDAEGEKGSRISILSGYNYQRFGNEKIHDHEAPPPRKRLRGGGGSFADWIADSGHPISPRHVRDYRSSMDRNYRPSCQIYGEQDDWNDRQTVWFIQLILSWRFFSLFSSSFFFSWENETMEFGVVWRRNVGNSDRLSIVCGYVY